MKHNIPKSNAYKLDFYYSIIYSIYFLVIAYIAFFTFKEAPAIYQSNPALFAIALQFLIFGSLTGISFPLIRSFYAVEISPDYIGGLNNPTPVIGGRIKVGWDRIDFITYQTFLFTTFYILHDQKGRVIAWIPFGIDNFDQFKKDLEQMVPGNKLLQLIKYEKRGYYLGIYPYLKNEFKEYSLACEIQIEHSRLDKPTSYKKVLIYYSDVLIKVVTTNHEGLLRTTFQFFPGTYILRISDNYYEGCVEVKLDEEVYKKVTMTVKRK